MQSKTRTYIISTFQSLSLTRELAALKCREWFVTQSLVSHV